jgi:hypothetical protein
MMAGSVLVATTTGVSSLTITVLAGGAGIASAVMTGSGGGVAATMVGAGVAEAYSFVVGELQPMAASAERATVAVARIFEAIMSVLLISGG